MGDRLRQTEQTEVKQLAYVSTSVYIKSVLSYILEARQSQAAMGSTVQK